MFSRFLSLALPLVVLSFPSASPAASSRAWDGVWAGMLNNSEPVTVTIAGGKVVSYAIRGGAPFGIAYSTVTLRSVAFGDHDNFDVKIVKISDRTALGIAHSPLGEGSAPLTRQ